MGYIKLFVTPVAWIVIMFVLAQFDNIHMRKAHDKHKIKTLHITICC